MNFLDKYTDNIYAVFRIVCGFLFIWHGTQKFFFFPIEFPYALGSTLYIAGIIELVAGTLIMLGLFTRCSAFIASGMMAVAYWLMHGLNSVFPLENGGELATIYCFSFLLISAHGAGIWSLDKLLEDS